MPTGLPNIGVLTTRNLRPIIIASLAGIILFVLFVNQRTLHFEERILREDTYRVFQLSKEISTNIKGAVYSAAEFPYAPCSQEDLDALRDMLWSYNYLMDIGRVYNNQVVCTAGRGVLDTPWPLPPSDNRASGARHWHDEPNLLGQEITSDMALYKNTLSFTSPFVFSQPVTTETNIGIFVVPSNQQFIYRQFGDLPVSAVKKPDPPRHWLPTTDAWLKAEFCIDDPGVCTIGIKESVGFFHLKWIYQALTVFIGANIGAYTYMLFFALSARRRSLKARLKKAIVEEKMYLEYQPKYHLASGRIVGAEALIRWKDKYLGQVRPDLFIPLAEKLGLISPLTDWIIAQTLKEMTDILHRYPDFHLSINLSLQDFTRHEVLELARHHCLTHNIDPAQVIFEVTERSVVGHESMSESAHKFNYYNYQISLDDFGTGYSNLSWLTKLRADEIKVDRSFTQSIGTSSINQSMLDAIFTLIQKLKVRVVFEGIENREEVDYILSHAPQAIGQGWLMSRSISAKDLTELMEKNSQTPDIYYSVKDPVNED